MIVVYAAVIRIEFIPEGAERGPTADIYFKIFKMGTCGIVGGVFGWPTLNQPNTAGGEGLSWMSAPEGSQYRSLHVTLPNTNEVRQRNYDSALARYEHSNGLLMSIA